MDFVSLLVGLIPVLNLIPRTDSLGKIALKLSQYTNPANFKFTATCCDGEWRDGKCSGTCDYSVSICLDYVNSTGNMKACPLGNQHIEGIGKLGESFKFPSIFSSGLLNPVPLAFTSWQGSIQIKIAFYDEDTTGEEIIDEFRFVHKQLVPVHGRKQSSSDFKLLFLTGIRKQNASSLVVAASVYCSRNYYQNDCTVKCVPQDDCSGHYHCNQSLGLKECHSGWHGENCNRLISPSFGCHSGNLCEHGSTCVNYGNKHDYYCCCPPGYSGDRCEVNINECEEKPCQNGGVCSELQPVSYRCQCPVTFSGQNCERPTLCTDKPCKNGGTCRDFAHLEFMCSCPRDFTGKTCETPLTTVRPTIKACAKNFYGNHCSVHCEESANCTTGQFSCDTETGEKICGYGWSGPLCNVRKGTARADVECPNSACRNGGKCINGSCCCPLGYKGNLCHIEILECERNPCRNGGTCKDLIADFLCICPTGYEGRTCRRKQLNVHTTSATVTPMTACDRVVCSNNGTCVPEKSKGFFCLCTDDYTGRLCTKLAVVTWPQPTATATPCKEHYYGWNCSVHCQQQNSCSGGHYTCDQVSGKKLCKSGWNGTECKNRILLPEKDPHCPRTSCRHGGQCFLGKCCCGDGYVGTFCEKEIIECAKKPCKNGGSCVELINGFNCSCIDGFTGKRCEKELISTAVSSSRSNLETTTAQKTSPCQPNPCANGATCFVRVADDATYWCRCPPDWTGRLCKTKIPPAGSTQETRRTSRRDSTEVPPTSHTRPPPFSTARSVPPSGTSRTTTSASSRVASTTVLNAKSTKDAFSRTDYVSMSIKPTYRTSQNVHETRKRSTRPAASIPRGRQSPPRPSATRSRITPSSVIISPASIKTDQGSTKSVMSRSSLPAITSGMSSSPTFSTTASGTGRTSPTEIASSLYLSSKPRTPLQPSTNVTTATQTRIQSKSYSSSFQYSTSNKSPTFIHSTKAPVTTASHPGSTTDRLSKTSIPDTTTLRSHVNTTVDRIQTTLKESTTTLTRSTEPSTDRPLLSTRGSTLLYFTDSKISTESTAAKGTAINSSNATNTKHAETGSTTGSFSLQTSRPSSVMPSSLKTAGKTGFVSYNPRTSETKTSHLTPKHSRKPLLATTADDVTTSTRSQAVTTTVGSTKAKASTRTTRLESSTPIMTTNKVRKTSALPTTTVPMTPTANKKTTVRSRRTPTTWDQNRFTSDPKTTIGKRHTTVKFTSTRTATKQMATDPTTTTRGPRTSTPKITSPKRPASTRIHFTTTLGKSTKVSNNKSTKQTRTSGRHSTKPTSRSTAIVAVTTQPGFVQYKFYLYTWVTSPDVAIFTNIVRVTWYWQNNETVTDPKELNAVYETRWHCLTPEGDKVTAFIYNITSRTNKYAVPSLTPPSLSLKKGIVSSRLQQQYNVYEGKAWRYSYHYDVFVMDRLNIWPGLVVKLREAWFEMYPKYKNCACTFELHIPLTARGLTPDGKDVTRFIYFVLVNSTLLDSSKVKGPDLEILRKKISYNSTIRVVAGKNVTKYTEFHRIYIVGKQISETDRSTLETVLTRSLSQTLPAYKNCSCLQVKIDKQEIYMTRDGKKVTKLLYTLYNGTGKVPLSRSENTTRFFNIVDMFLNSTQPFQRNKNRVYRHNIQKLVDTFYAIKLRINGEINQYNWKSLGKVLIQAWKEEYSNVSFNFSIQILKIIRYVGIYGTQFSGITYFVLRPNSYVNPRRLSPPREATLAAILSQTDDLYGIYAEILQLRLSGHFQVMLNKTVNPFGESGSALQIILEEAWTRYLQGQNPTCLANCSVQIVFAKTQRYISADGFEISKALYFVLVDGTLIDPQIISGPSQQDLENEGVNVCNCMAFKLRRLNIKGIVRFRDMVAIEDSLSYAWNHSNIERIPIEIYDREEFCTKSTGIYTEVWYVAERDDRTDVTVADPEEIRRYINSNTSRVSVEAGRMLYTVNLLNSVDRRKQEKSVLIALKNAWLAANLKIPENLIGIQMYVWDGHFYREPRGIVTQVRFTVSVGEVESSLTALAEPTRLQYWEALKGIHLSLCNCKALKERSIYIIGPVEGEMIKRIEQVLKEAWQKENPDFGGNITVHVRSLKSDYKGSNEKDNRSEFHESDVNFGVIGAVTTYACDKEQLTRVIYTVIARIENRTLPDKDLVPVTMETITETFKKLEPKIKIYLGKASSDDGITNDKLLKITIGIVFGSFALLLILFITGISIRNMRHRQAQDLINDPSQLEDGKFNREHFASEPTSPVSFENPTFTEAESYGNSHEKWSRVKKKK